jgi:hypothetical protein
MDNSILFYFNVKKVEDKSERKRLTFGQFLSIDKVVGAG